MLLTQVYGPLNDGAALGHGMLALRNTLLLAIVAVGVARVRAETSRPEPTRAHA
jgi:hypothetical protein